MKFILNMETPSSLIARLKQDSVQKDLFLSLYEKSGTLAAKHFNCQRGSVGVVYYALGGTKRRKRFILTPELLEDSKNRTLTSIAKEFDVSVATVSMEYKRLGLTKLKKVNSWSSLSIEYQMYLAGYILGDGHFVGDNEFGIRCSELEHIRKIASILADDLHVSTTSGGRDVIVNGKKTGVSGPSYSIAVRDSSIRKGLDRIGIVHRKSFIGCTLNMELVQAGFWHFMRGLLDSDGCVTYNKSSNRVYPLIKWYGHPSYLKQLVGVLNAELNCAETVHEHQKGGVSVIRVNRRKLVEEIYEKMYVDATLFNSRKKSLFEQYLS